MAKTLQGKLNKYKVILRILWIKRFIRVKELKKNN